MLQLAVPLVVLHAKDRQAIDSGLPEAVAVMGMAKHARCIRPPVQAVGMRLRYLSNQEKIDLYTVAVATSRKAPVALMIVDLAGNLYERDCSTSG
jgi:hypothetical protein